VTGANPVPAAAVVGALSLVIGLSINLIAGPPIPRVHDEFSYLLAADTFARGRLTNPPHPMWPHFETMHELFQPTYASKFHPAQGLTLALGQVLFGAPWVGAVITIALACAATTWALYGWLPPRWAVLGGLLCAVHPQVVVWSHMYWSGGVGMLGGALVFGAIPRILGSHHVARNAAILALGGAILAMSRPYEAIVWATLSGATLLVWSVKQPARDVPRLLARLALPALAVLVPAGAWLGYYNWRVTGDPREMPYTLHARQYMAVPLLFWQEVDPPKTCADYRHAPLADQHLVFEWRYFHGQRSPRGWLVAQGVKLGQFAKLHLLWNSALAVGIVAAPVALRLSRRAMLAAVYALGFCGAYASVPWFEHHYPAAVLPAVFALGVHGLRLVRHWRRFGRALVWACAVACTALVGVVFAREYRANRRDWWYERHKIEQRLLAEPRAHLVFVRYGDAHEHAQEWVFNAADIDASKVVWARMISPSEDRNLLEYYPQRKVWVVDADADPAVLTPYPLPRGEDGGVRALQ
jgi:hypothetical protein